MSFLQETPSHLDDIDRKLLQALVENARTSFTELGQQIGLSRSAVAERVRRLEEMEVIRGYRADVNYARLGYPILAYIRVRTERATSPNLLTVLHDLPEILEGHRGTGDDCYILKVVIASIEHLDAVLESIRPYGHPTTSIVLSSLGTQRIILEAPPRKREKHRYMLNHE